MSSNDWNMAASKGKAPDLSKRRDRAATLCDKSPSPLDETVMRHTIFASLLVLLPASPAALAADCANATDQATMNECADAGFKKSDAELNALYKKIEQRLKDNGEAKKMLVAVQRAWVSFRDAEIGR